MLQIILQIIHQFCNNFSIIFSKTRKNNFLLGFINKFRHIHTTLKLFLNISQTLTLILFIFSIFPLLDTLLSEKIESSCSIIEKIFNEMKTFVDVMMMWSWRECREHVKRGYRINLNLLNIY